jgi:tRNA1Val (adenine37-N6)-methyltransferase
MPNDFFQFKKFKIEQEKCAMKVCTDACLFGAWVSEIVNRQSQIANKILDIGAGTGLLPLMVAQKSNQAIIDAVEIDKSAATQCSFNFQQSPWNERLHVHHSSIQQFNQSSNQLYNFIISNPPFFENDLKSKNTKRNIALHSDALSLEELLFAINSLLIEDGNFAVLLPFHRSDFFEKLVSKKNYFLQKKILVKQTPKHEYFRSMSFFGKQEMSKNISSIIIKDEENKYTGEFALLLKDYYLNL